MLANRFSDVSSEPGQPAVKVGVRREDPTCSIWRAAVADEGCRPRLEAAMSFGGSQP